MSYTPNQKFQAAILKRLSVLLGTDRPAHILSIMVQRLSVQYPEIDLDEDYSVVEDLVIQEIIKKYKDHKLDQLWLNYNFGYFQEDTETLLRSKLGDGYENFINSLVNDNSVCISRSNVLAA